MVKGFFHVTKLLLLNFSESSGTQPNPVVHTSTGHLMFLEIHIITQAGVVSFASFASLTTPAFTNYVNLEEGEMTCEQVLGALNDRIRLRARTVTEAEKQECGNMEASFYHACLADERYILGCSVAESACRKRICGTCSTILPMTWHNSMMTTCGSYHANSIACNIDAAICFVQLC